jgi:hypothetical protein
MYFVLYYVISTQVREPRCPIYIPGTEISTLFYFILFYSFIHMCVYCLGHFSPLLPSLTLSPPSPHFQAEPVLPLSLILWKRRHKHNKEDKAFLLVELRIAIQRDS